MKGRMMMFKEKEFGSKISTEQLKQQLEEVEINNLMATLVVRRDIIKKEVREGILTFENFSEDDTVGLFNIWFDIAGVLGLVPEINDGDDIRKTTLEKMIIVDEVEAKIRESVKKESESDMESVNLKRVKFYKDDSKLVSFNKRDIFNKTDRFNKSEIFDKSQKH
jgi:hypothetical protein